MIIYTHEDVLKMMNTFHTSTINRDLCLAKLTPIRLPQEETLYTEEQIRKAYFRSRNIDELIQSLKQSKL
jgi:hypothetical protein